MLCPFCKTQDSKVIDSRAVNDGQQIRRRRECIKCNARFTSYEIIELIAPKVLKKDGNIVNFDADKIQTGMLKALEKRPISIEQINLALQNIIRQIQTTNERTISTTHIGQLVIKELIQLDDVAYLRFISVYQQFANINDFQTEISKLHKVPDETNSH